MAPRAITAIVLAEPGVKSLRDAIAGDTLRVDDGRAVRVRITDRGPFGHEERIIDLSHGAAEKIGMLRAGVVLAAVNASWSGM